jgi:hypothetical protein
MEFPQQFEPLISLSRISNFNHFAKSIP